MNTRELLPAVAVSPWAVVPVVVISGLGSSDAGLLSDLGWGVFFSIAFALPVAYIGVVCVGLPAYLVLRRFRAASPLWLGLVGASIPFAVFFESRRPREGIIAAACGLAVALVAARLLPKSGKNVP
jgi:hypothetical protein